MTMLTSVRLAWVSCAAIGAIPGLSAAQAIVDLGLLPGGTFTLGGTLSDNGLVQCGDGDVAGGAARAWRWTAATGKQNLGVSPGADHSYAYGMSGNGLVVVGASGGSAYDTACRWTQATGMQSLGSLAPGMPSFAFDASADGSVIVGDGYLANGAQRAFRWTAATGLQTFGALVPGTAHAVGLCVSANGSTLAGYCYNNAPSLVYPTACVWNSAGAVTSLGVLPGSIMSLPGEMNADGSVIIGYCSADGGGVRAFRWSVASGMLELPAPLGASDAVASAITADGSVVVGYAVVNGQSQACLWTGGTVQILASYLQSQGVATAGWELTGATINADGSTYAGTGIHNGVTVAWRVALACSGAPTVTVEPLDAVVTEGAPASFTVAASGIGARFQWYHDNVMITNAVQPAYSILATSPSDAGQYWCTVTSACGSATSRHAMLTVNTNCLPPQVLEQPADETKCARGSYEFSVTSSGSPSYQWQRETFLDSGQFVDLADGSSSAWDGTPPGGGAIITGSRSASLAVEADTNRGLVLAPVHEVHYRCVVSNECGGEASNGAMLTVCLADFDCSAGVDGDDVILFFGAWDSNDAAADVTHDGGVDGDDVIAFFEQWDRGC